ncbi:MAG: SGNH/GDSL hydrolase family protein [Acidobacteria bacterium]|nr:SGNH/GDSL hydrolase family protein [Acidobacteriota bacterium]
MDESGRRASHKLLRTGMALLAILLVAVPADFIPSTYSHVLPLPEGTPDGMGCRGNAVRTTAWNHAVENTIRVYVAGESIEQRNRFVAPPFTPTGALNERGGGALRNDDDEYGWMVPMADRLRLRDSSLLMDFVGSDTWLDAEDQPYTGTYPSTTPGHTSAISGTDIPSWLEQRESELEQRTHCYDVAFASRGGNDFAYYSDEEYKANLKRLVRLLAAGSSCQANPIIYVTAHMPDDQRGDGGDPPDVEYVKQQLHDYVERSKEAVTELRASQPNLRIRFVDMYTPFRVNQPTTAFPREVWSVNGVSDYLKIGRLGDLRHPRRLASIYAGEIVADALDLAELRQLPTATLTDTHGFVIVVSKEPIPRVARRNGLVVPLARPLETGSTSLASPRRAK